MLSLTSVSAGYGSFQALFGVSLEVPQGEAVGVIGPNGAGKTTLMRVISGLMPLRDGAMTLDGRPVGGLPGASHGRAGHRACAGEPSAVSAAERRRQSAHRRLHPAGAASVSPSSSSGSTRFFRA